MLRHLCATPVSGPSPQTRHSRHPPPPLELVSKVTSSAVSIDPGGSINSISNCLRPLFSSSVNSDRSAVESVRPHGDLKRPGSLQHSKWLFINPQLRSQSGSGFIWRPIKLSSVPMPVTLRRFSVPMLTTARGFFDCHRWLVNSSKRGCT